MIKPHCIKCKKELEQFGGIVLTSPLDNLGINPEAPKGWIDEIDEELKIIIEAINKLNKKGHNIGLVAKYHICQKCEKLLANWLIEDLFKKE